MRTLDAKVMVVTGAGSGIGRALALNAAARGAALALSDKDEVGLLATAERAEELNGREIRTDKLDVSDRDAVHRYATAVAGDLGRVNILVNNAGVAAHGDFEEMSEDDFAWVMDTNFWGVVHGTRAFLPHLIASGDGHLVNISSLYGLMAMPADAAYTASKFGVRGFTEALRMEMLVKRHPVQVSCVHPGGIKTAIARNARTSPSVDRQQMAQLFDTTLARTTPERAADVIIDGVLADRARIVVGADARLLDLVVRATGSRYQAVVARAARKLAR